MRDKPEKIAEFIRFRTMGVVTGMVKKEKRKKVLTLRCLEAGDQLPQIQQPMIAAGFPLCEGQRPHCSHRLLFEPELTLLDSGKRHPPGHLYKIVVDNEHLLA